MSFDLSCLPFWPCRWFRACLRCLVVLLASILLFPASASAWQAVVIRVIDGDTLLAAPQGALEPELATMSVRLYGIDAPELAQPGGEEAKAALEQRVPPGSLVEIIPKTDDRYHRTVALVFLKGQLLNVEQLRHGFAWVYPAYCRTRYCPAWVQAENKARADRRGLWEQSEPVPPWQWRKKS